MRIVFIGPPGAGKGTQASLLAKKIKVPHLSTGELLRTACRQQTEIGAQACDAMEAGSLVSDKLVHEMVVARVAQVDCKRGYVLDGFPRTVCQAEMFDKLLAEQDASLDVVLNIHVEELELLKRLASRGRRDDDAAVIKNRLAQYENLTRPLLDYYQDREKLYTVDGHSSPDNVRKEVFEVIHKVCGLEGNACSS